jgi:hypothetical protein
MVAKSTSRAVELVVGSTWDGVAIPAEERTRVRLRLARRELHVAVRAPLHGDPAPRAAPGPTEGLWDHEVVELFLSGPPAEGAVPYLEIEIGPWGHHLVLSLRGVRNAVARGLPLRLRVVRHEGCWIAAAALDRGLLPPPPWRANAYAIHGVGAARRYLASAPLSGARPDFHQPDRFPELDLRDTE